MTIHENDGLIDKCFSVVFDQRRCSGTAKFWHSHKVTSKRPAATHFRHFKGMGSVQEMNHRIHQAPRYNLTS